MGRDWVLRAVLSDRSGGTGWLSVRVGTRSGMSSALDASGGASFTMAVGKRC
jgi:hypothetical protein